MFECKCSKEYKTETAFNKHVLICPYTNIDLTKIYAIGKLINEENKFLFHVALGKIKKYAKDNEISFDDAKTVLQKEVIYKYRKSLWDILNVWKTDLLPSEYRVFIKWVFKTYKDISLISLRNTLSNEKILYRFNLEHTAKMIEKRVDDSLRYVHNNKLFSNDFVFIDAIMSGEVSMYYVLFNDWLAEEWFGRLDVDLQSELEDYINIASKNILDRLKHKEFDVLQTLANSDTPIIYEMY